jgi:hypothetical protein
VFIAPGNIKSVSLDSVGIASGNQSSRAQTSQHQSSSPSERVGTDRRSYASRAHLSISISGHRSSHSYESSSLRPKRQALLTDVFQQPSRHLMEHHTLATPIRLSRMTFRVLSVCAIQDLSPCLADTVITVHTEGDSLAGLAPLAMIITHIHTTAPYWCLIPRCVVLNTPLDVFGITHTDGTTCKRIYGSYIQREPKEFLLTSINHSAAYDTCGRNSRSTRRPRDTPIPPHHTAVRASPPRARIHRHRGEGTSGVHSIHPSNQSHSTSLPLAEYVLPSHPPQSTHATHWLRFNSHDTRHASTSYRHTS